MDAKNEPEWFTNFKAVWNDRWQNIEGKLEDLNGLKTEVLESKNKIETLLQENDRLKIELSMTHQRIVQIESQSRRENLIFEGIPDTKSESWSDCENKLYTLFKQHLKMENSQEIKFERVHRLGQYDSSKARPIIAKFSFYKDRMLIWNSRTKLKGSSIWIAEDYPAEIMKARKILFPILRKAQQIINDPNNDTDIRKVSINVDKLILNGKQYSVQDIAKLPSVLRLENIATKTEGDKTVFYSRNSILSNFYQHAPFKIDGISYNCTEQYIQNAKALLFEDETTAHKIMKTADPFEQYKLGQQVKGFKDQQWMEKAENIVLKANTAKYTQNLEARRVLIATGKNKLGEATENQRWGIGMRLENANVMNIEYWTGRNLFGKILEQVRENVK